MLPEEPARNPSYGYLYFPPYRVQGSSIAGEETFVQVPELDICFDIGRAPRLALTSNFVALSHGHMDHAAGISYYYSQRHFQGMGTGTILCHEHLDVPIRRLMSAWIDIEAQRTPYQVVAMKPGTPSEEFELKNHIYIRAFETDHTVPSLGFVVVERRSKLREEFHGLPQDKLIELKQSGQDITYIKEVPLVAYMGDTGPGDFFFRPDVANAKVLITECTFVDPDHRDRARVGKHLHISDLQEMMPRLNCQNIVITHLSRRTHIGQTRQQFDKIFSPSDRTRLHILMDGRTNRDRYQQQMDAAVAAANAKAAAAAPAEDEAEADPGPAAADERV
jgi:ribonuclease Z